MITNVFAPFFYRLTLNSFNEKDFDLTGKILLWQHDSIKFAYVVSNRLSHLLVSGLKCVFARFLLWLLQKSCVFESKIRLIGLNFLLLAQRYSFW